MAENPLDNPTIAQLLQRRSVRAFTGEHVRDADLDAILRATQQAPTSINGQQLSLIVVRERDRIERLAELAGHQPQVAAADVVVVFVVDYARTAEAARLHGREQVIQTTAEGVLVGAVDAGIALATFQTAAGALGYGTTAIGGVRKEVARVIELLELPRGTFPVVASTLGVPDPERATRVKPRLPLESFALPERYDADAVAEGVRIYDDQLRDWWDAQGLQRMATYSDETSRLYANVYYPGVADALRAQGFGFADAE